MTRDDTAALADRWLRALDTRAADAFSQLYGDHAVVESPLGGTLGGPEGVRKAFDAFFAAFPDAKITAEPPCIDGGRVVIVASIAGTQTGSIAGLPPSGRPFRFSLVFLLTVRDGMVVHDRRIYDFTGLLVQLGMLKTKIKDR